MKEPIRILLVWFLHGLLWIGLTVLNDLLAPLGVAVSGEALYLLFPAFFLRGGGAIALAALTGLMADAQHPGLPVPHLLLFPVVTVGLLLTRLRLRREKPAHLILAGVAAQTVIFAIAAAQAVVGGDLAPWAGIRLAQDLCASLLVQLLLAHHWVGLVDSLFFWLGTDFAAETSLG